jgi:molybdate transport system ATP-binding protein
MSVLQIDCHFQRRNGFTLHAQFQLGTGITALFGHSGAGKSTTLALLAGILRPHSGSIHLAGRPLVDTHRGIFLPPEQRHLGILFQEHLLFPHLNVRQNLLFGAQRRGTPMNLLRVANVLEIVSLLDRMPHTLSGGEQQRVALGRALMCGPEILLLDEPLTALEPSLKDRILDYLERIVAEWQIPVLFVSHNQADVRRLAPQIVVLEAGRVVASGNTAQIFEQPPPLSA